MGNHAPRHPHSFRLLHICKLELMCARCGEARRHLWLSCGGDASLLPNKVPRCGEPLLPLTTPISWDDFRLLNPLTDALLSRYEVLPPYRRVKNHRDQRELHSGCPRDEAHISPKGEGPRFLFLAELLGDRGDAGGWGGWGGRGGRGGWAGWAGWGCSHCSPSTTATCSTVEARSALILMTAYNSLGEARKGVIIGASSTQP